MTIAPFLREVPLLAGVPAAMLERLAAGARFVGVPAGAWLLREGEDAASAFVLSAGWLEVVSERPPQRGILR